MSTVIDRTENRKKLLCEFPTDELECARTIVGMLFDYTGLATIVDSAPTVIVGGGNWMSFRAAQKVPIETILALRVPDGDLAFRPDVMHPSQSVRSRTSPSLHLTHLDSGENLPGLTGHVDGYYWAQNPLGHADEFLTRKTAAPSELLRRLTGFLGPAQASSASWAMEKPGKV